jgi:hypothetical protein
MSRYSVVAVVIVPGGYREHRFRLYDEANAGRSSLE